MNPEKVINIFGSIVVLAMVATLVSPRAQTAKVAKALGDVFVGGIKAAKDLDG